MAALSDADRAALHREFMQLLSAANDPIGTLTEAQLRTAANDIDAWVDANSAAFNSAISQPARGALTTKQKARLLMLVVRRRWEVAV